MIHSGWCPKSSKSRLDFCNSFRSVFELIVSAFLWMSTDAIQAVWLSKTKDKLMKILIWITIIHYTDYRLVSTCNNVDTQLEVNPLGISVRRGWEPVRWGHHGNLSQNPAPPHLLALRKGLRAHKRMRAEVTGCRSPKSQPPRQSHQRS